MILLAIQIGLTIAAWKRGWKGWALLPILVGSVIAFLSGYIYGLAVGPGVSEADFSNVMIIGLIIDFSITGVLIGMVVKGRTRETKNQISANVTGPTVRSNGVIGEADSETYSQEPTEQQRGVYV